jgi:hypothetical protein
MLGVGLVGVLAVYVAGVAWRAIWGAAPAAPVRFPVVAGVSAVIHLGFHAAATAAPTLDAVALVLAGWSSFGLWCVWLGRVPSAGFRRPHGDEDDGGEGDGGGGGGPGDGPPDEGPPGGGTAIDWDAFERDFAAYVRRGRPGREPARQPAPAAD